MLALIQEVGQLALSLPAEPAVALAVDEFDAFRAAYLSAVRLQEGRRAMVATLALGLYAAALVGLGFGRRHAPSRLLGLGFFSIGVGMGVMITGESGVGKSELALELISRGHGLVADDVVELRRIAPETLEGRCPPMLRDYLEVRGLGMLNIRTIFGETAVRRHKNMKLIVHLQNSGGSSSGVMERLPISDLTENIMNVDIRKVVIPVAAGRNLAVLVEAAVRNYVLQLRGIDGTKEFIERHEREMNNELIDKN